MSHLEGIFGHFRSLFVILSFSGHSWSFHQISPNFHHFCVFFKLLFIRLSTRKECLARDIERLSLERAEMSENCSKMREREAGIRHTLDLEEMGLERVRLDDVNVEQQKLARSSYNTVLNGKYCCDWICWTRA